MVSMATHRPSLNASSRLQSRPDRPPDCFNGHSSAIPQCIFVTSSRFRRLRPTFQWPLIGHPSMHPRVRGHPVELRRVSMATHRSSLQMHLGRSAGAAFVAVRVSMATHRPSLNASPAPCADQVRRRLLFQWPLIGHTSMHPPLRVDGVHRLREFQWPLIGHPSMHRRRTTMQQPYPVAFQWPLTGHTSMHREATSLILSIRVKVSMATHSAIPQCIVQHGLDHALFRCTFQWPLIGHPSMHRKNCLGSWNYARVSMATHRPSLNASAAVLQWPNLWFGFQWPLIGHPSMHLKTTEDIKKS